jgi:hypothetical protein
MVKRNPNRECVALLVCVLVTPVGAQPSPGWEVRIPDRVEVASGATAQVPIAIAVDRGLAVSRDAPILIDLAGEPGVTIKKRRLGRADAVDPEADAPRFVLAVRADAAGEHGVGVRIRLWICARATCRPVELQRRVTISVGA